MKPAATGPTERRPRVRPCTMRMASPGRSEQIQLLTSVAGRSCQLRVSASLRCAFRRSATTPALRIESSPASKMRRQLAASRPTRLTAECWRCCVGRVNTASTGTDVDLVVEPLKALGLTKRCKPLPHSPWRSTWIASSIFSTHFPLTDRTAPLKSLRVRAHGARRFHRRRRGALGTYRHGGIPHGRWCSHRCAARRIDAHCPLGHFAASCGQIATRHGCIAPTSGAAGIRGDPSAADSAFIIVMEMVGGHAMVPSLTAAALGASLVARWFRAPLYVSLAVA